MVKKFEKEKKVEHIDRCKAENYVFKEKYAAIVFKSCVGYLNDYNLMLFLKKAKKHLVEGRKKITRAAGPSALIIVFDSVIEDDEVGKTEAGQRYRSQAELEEIFRVAELEIYKRSLKRTLVGNFTPVMQWALY